MYHYFSSKVVRVFHHSIYNNSWKVDLVLQPDLKDWTTAYDYKQEVL